MIPGTSNAGTYPTIIDIDHRRTLYSIMVQVVTADITRGTGLYALDQDDPFVTIRMVEPVALERFVFPFVDIPAAANHRAKDPVLHAGRFGAMPIPTMRPRKIKRWKRCSR